MKLGIILYSNDPETVLNALDLASHAIGNNDQVKICLLGKGVEIESVNKAETYASQPLKIMEQVQTILDAGGEVFASAKCLAARELEPVARCTASPIADVYAIISDSDKVVTF